MVQLIGNYIDTKKKATWRYIEEWQGTLYSMVVFGATMVVMFWASVFLYTSFYFTYMPQESITWPIHFQYNACEDRPGICTNPEAIISVTDPARGSLLARGQKYRVVVDLEMPESTTNQKLGMFLVSMDMRSHGGETLRQASRSTMLRFKSSLLQTISTMAFAPFFLYGVQEEKQMVTVELFSQYEEDPVTPLSEVYVRLVTKHVELYGAQLRIHAVFSGLRYLMYHYPLTAAALGIGICMVFLSAVVIFSWYQFSGSAGKQVGRPRQVSFPNGRATGIGPGRSAGAGVQPMDALPKVVPAAARKSGLEIAPEEKEASPNEEALKEVAKDEEGDLEGGAALPVEHETEENGSPVQQGSEAEGRDSDEFEVVCPSKNPVNEETSRKLSRACDEDTVLRQRVQPVDVEP
ncbi:seipin-like isoform X2 [Penaeus chinensis]|uniref:seipin-like isoform X2 n=1 Tax=Penaeus chinensis TaxID=139456 RepID=UPI001FB69E6D|nr:seipin-like isoform X2 [Penaeus chinensis]